VLEETPPGLVLEQLVRRDPAVQAQREPDARDQVAARLRGGDDERGQHREHEGEHGGAGRASLASVRLLALEAHTGAVEGGARPRHVPRLAVAVEVPPAVALERRVVERDLPALVPHANPVASDSRVLGEDASAVPLDPEAVPVPDERLAGGLNARTRLVGLRNHGEASAGVPTARVPDEFDGRLSRAR
jgi:hypothetical protein